jgi:hypothetical protein
MRIGDPAKGSNPAGTSMEMLAAPIGLFAVADWALPPPRRRARAEGKPTCAMRAQPDNCRSSLAYRSRLRVRANINASADFTERSLKSPTSKNARLARQPSGTVVKS